MGRKKLSDEERKERIRDAKLKYRQNNKEKVSAAMRAYREQNKEKALAAVRAYREQNKEKALAAARAYREQNKEKALAASRAYKEKIRAQKRKIESDDISSKKEKKINVEPLNLGEMNRECEHCKALSFPCETGRAVHNCCHQGKIMLPKFSDWPKELTDLLYGTNEINKHFRQNIRVYNSLFAFASFNSANNDLKFNTGLHSIGVKGQGLVKMNTALKSEQPSYGQIYLYDDGEAIHLRSKIVKREDVLKILQPIMNRNPYAIKFRRLNEVYEMGQDKEVHLAFYKHLSPGEHPRIYNKPTCDELAAVINSKTGEINNDVEIRVYPNAEADLKFINLTSPHIDPLLSPILFPNGDTGWTYTLTHVDGQKRISPTQHYGFRFAYRKDADGRLDPILCCQRLTQQYIITAYLKVENSRLQWLRANQNQLRGEHLQGLMDHVQNSAINTSDKYKLGKAIILPSTYAGSPRAMQKLYHDAMAISRTVGRPDLFITMTCNPQWPEIKQLLKDMPPETTANDVPHLVCRVFYAKCVCLLDEIAKEFGKIRAYVYTIEFQKRGLPHMHLLVTLQEKLLTPESIDRYVCAEIPDKDEDPCLWYKVIKHMSHGPHTSKSPCWNEEKGTCTKKFPKEFCEATDMTKQGFPAYRRRDNRSDCHTYHGKKAGKIINVDNSMIVPYNPYLLKRFDCHLNVEYCASVMSIKYIYKYIHKGHDRAKITKNGGENNDEIQNYIDCRYVSAMECAWHLAELPMQKRSHAVESLPVHTPNNQYVSFKAGEEENAIKKAKTRSKLVAYFKLCATDKNAQKYLYHQIPTHYTWNKGTCKWVQRKVSGKTVSRLNIVSPRDIERFHLKLLLQHVKGATSFDHLKTVDGVLCSTFHEAARLMGICKSDTYMQEILTDAASVMMPDRFRHFFVYLIIGGEIDALAMWEKFKQPLSEKTNTSTALSIIRDLLEKEGFTLQQFGLPEKAINESEIEEVVKKEEDFTIEEHKAIYEEMYLQMNNDQRRAFDAIASSLKSRTDDDPPNNLFFIDGPGGTGKTFVYKCLVHYCRHLATKIATIAWTGIAAVLLPYGRTAHKTFNLPLQYDDPTIMLNWSKKLKDQLYETEVFIWDEASMIPQTILTILDRTLRDIFGSDKPFAGKYFILGGDFRQVLPVVKKGGRKQIYEACLKNSIYWPLFKKYQLTINMRAASDKTGFAEWLLEIGNSTLKELYLTPDLLTENIIDEFYPDGITATELAQRAILAARNDEVKKINNCILERMPGETVKCISVDSASSLAGDDTDHENTALQYPPEYLASLTPSGLPPAELNLKVGCIVMLLRNLCISDGLCNGTRLIVRKIDRRILHAELLSGDKKGTVVHIPRITTDTMGSTDMPFVLKRLQFPVRLAFAMTINKSQGQSFEKVGLIVQNRDTIFSHGQLYVALSRCTSRAGIKIECRTEEKIIENIVFEEAL